MNMGYCSKGHYYDWDQYSSCPQCAAEAAANGYQGADDYGATEPMTGATSGTTLGETQPATEGNNPGWDNSRPGGVDDYEPTMVHEVGNIAGFAPVVGWLVCIDGPERGKDYRIRSGNNYIGRSEHMDICLRGDNKISRDRQAVLAYDDLDQTFYFGNGFGANLVRVNNKAVTMQVELKAHDVLTIGSTRLMFIPLCGPEFDWSKI